MLCYNLELTKRGNTALYASGTHREMRYVKKLLYRLRTCNVNV